MSSTLTDLFIALKRDDDSYCDVAPVDDSKRERIQMTSNTAYQTLQGASDENTYDYIAEK